MGRLSPFMKNADAFGIRGFGEIRSGYDARAIGNSMAVIDSPFARGRGPLRAASPLLRNLPSERCSSAHSAGIGFRQDVSVVNPLKNHVNDSTP